MLEFFSIAWIVIVGTFFLLFGVLETLALTNKIEEDTLSERIRKWFGVETTRGKVVWLVSFGLFATWFLIHIPFGSDHWF